MAAGIEDDSVGSGRIAAIVELLASVQWEHIAAWNGAEAVCEGDASGWGAVSRYARNISAQVDEAAEGTTGEWDGIPLGIGGKHGKGCRTRLGRHDDRDWAGIAGGIGGVAGVLSRNAVRSASGQVVG